MTSRIRAACRTAVLAAAAAALTSLPDASYAAPKPAKPKPPTVVYSGAKKAATVTLSFGRFGTVTVYQPASPPVHATIFLSGDGGWNNGVVDMAKMLVAKDYLVIGVNVPRYLANAGKVKQRCVYPPGDLQTLSQFVQKKLGIRRYLVPSVVGYSSGATLAYAALAEAPAGTFEGAVSLGFCSDIDVKKPLCRGEGLESKALIPTKTTRGYDLSPFKSLPAPWYALHGKVDQVCNLKKTQTFVAATGNGHFVALDKVGHGFGNQRRWQAQFEQAMRDIAAAGFAQRPHSQAPSVAQATNTGAEVSGAGDDDLDLPVIETPADTDAPPTDQLALLISGDGGWAGLDREVAGGLADAGVPVIGLDSLQYFWSTRTPDGAARDIQRLLQTYLQRWGKTKVIAVGYSFGADVLPFFLSRLPPALRQRLSQIVLISPSSRASFEFKVGDWFGSEDDGVPTLPVAPEVAKLAGTPLLCFYGKEDHTALCPSLGKSAQVVALEGSHRLADSWDELTATILQGAGLKAPAD